MEYKFKLLSSLEKVFFKEPVNAKPHTHGSMFKNEIYSFQLAGWALGEEARRIMCKLKVESALAPYIQVFQVGYVPNLMPSMPFHDDEDYIAKEPGLFPDPLFKIRNDEILLECGQARSFWIAVEPTGQITGTFPIVLKVYDANDTLLDALCFELEIIDEELPKQELYNTCWFHGDCIAKLHNVEVLSEKYWALVEKYLDVYVKFGHNMILTPIITPPLDTAIGKERPTNQLVDITVTNGVYSFGFTNLKRWIDLCRTHGIEYFEIAHLFTQWGAKHAPKIMAMVDGRYEKIFGWETDALSEEYTGFLHAFLPELIEFLKAEGVMDKCFFHTSDEPVQAHEVQYKAAKEILQQYIDDSQLMDALSNYSFYEKGIVKKPVVSNNHIHHFMEHGVNGLWTYYCCMQGDKVANRFLAMPSYRNRILGYQLYKNDIEGFLQWGFNFWFSQHSRGVINPYLETTAGGAYPGGDAYVVYPVDEAGDVVCALRLYVFNEGLQDMRALKLLESRIGKEAVMALLEEVQGFDVYPRDSEYIFALREKVNQMIKQGI